MPSSHLAYLRRLDRCIGMTLQELEREESTFDIDLFHPLGHFGG